MAANRVHTIVFANEKGGTGKSTTAVHVAIALAAKGARVAALDLDHRQRTLARYLENRAATMKRTGKDLPQPRYAAHDGVSTDRFDELVGGLSENADFLVIDTPGRDDPFARIAATRADSLVTPMNDSFVDFDLIGQVDPDSYKVTRPSFYSELIWDARKARAKADGATIDWVVLRNRLQHIEAKNMRRVGLALDQLSKRVGFRVIPGLGERVIYRELFRKGLTLVDSRAFGEMGLAHVAARQELREMVAALALPEPATALVALMAKILLAALVVAALWLWWRRGRRGVSLTVAEALATLDLPAGADESAIRAAHRRLIARVHPDSGGTAALAARINAARDVLLREHKKEILRFTVSIPPRFVNMTFAALSANLGEADAHAIGRGFASIVRRAGGTRVVVGRDGRHSSPAFETALIDGLTASGVDVVRIGLGPTPMLYYAEAVLEVDGGIQITGSHNPAEYNGFKMVLQHKPFFGAQIQELGRMAAEGDWDEPETPGTVDDADIEDEYVGRLMAGYAGGAYRVGWDAGNGAAGAVIEKLVKLLPGEHHTIFTDIDGDFPNHHPDPTEEKNLAHLKRLVADNNLDFGLAFDGDGDRIGAIDGQGRVIWGDQILSILAEPVLKELPGAVIIADVKASQALFDRVRELGGKPEMWKTGHSLIKTRMKETNAPLAGEMSGHIFFAHDYYGFDDAQYAAVRLIRAVHMIGKSMTEIRGAMPQFVNTPEMRFQVDESRKFAVVDEVLERLKAEGADVDHTDGARVSTPDGWWLLRASNTQDVLVARAEAKDQAGLDRLMAMIDAQLAASGLERGPQAGH